MYKMGGWGWGRVKKMKQVPRVRTTMGISASSLQNYQAYLPSLLFISLILLMIELILFIMESIFKARRPDMMRAIRHEVKQTLHGGLMMSVAWWMGVIVVGVDNPWFVLNVGVITYMILNLVDRQVYPTDPSHRINAIRLMTTVSLYIFGRWVMSPVGGIAKIEPFFPPEFFRFLVTWMTMVLQIGLRRSCFHFVKTLFYFL